MGLDPDPRNCGNFWKLSPTWDQGLGFNPGPGNFWKFNSSWKLGIEPDPAPENSGNF